MSNLITTLIVKKGLEANRLLYTPLEGELLYTTDEKKLFIGDGITLGGNPISSSDIVKIYDTFDTISYPMPVINGDAETGDTTGWTNEVGGLGVVAYNNTTTGSSYYFNGGTVANTTASQNIDLIANGLTQEQINTGASIFRLDFRTSSYASDTDNVSVGLRFKNTLGTTIGEVYSETFNDDTDDNWITRYFEQVIPVNTTSVDILLKFVRITGTNSDGRIDFITASVYAQTLFFDDIPGIPTPSANKYLKRNDDNTAYEWADGGGGVDAFDKTSLVYETTVTTATNTVIIDGLNLESGSDYIIDIGGYNNTSTDGINCWINGDETQSNYLSTHYRVVDASYGDDTFTYPSICLAAASTSYYARAHLKIHNNIVLCDSNSGSFNTTTDRIDRRSWIYHISTPVITQLSLVTNNGYTAIGPNTRIRIFKDLSGGVNTILNGVIPPVDTLGSNGDFYIDTNLKEIYGPKTNGTWGTPIESKLPTTTPTVLKNITVESDTNEIDITGLNAGNGISYRLLIQGISASATDSALYLYINDDVIDTNYKNSYHSYYNTTILKGYDNNPTIAGSESSSTYTVDCNIYIINNVIKINSKLTFKYSNYPRVTERLWTYELPITKLNSIKLKSSDSGNLFGAETRVKLIDDNGSNLYIGDLHDVNTPLAGKYLRRSDDGLSCEWVDGSNAEWWISSTEIPLINPSANDGVTGWTGDLFVKTDGIYGGDINYFACGNVADPYSYQRVDITPYVDTAEIDANLYAFKLSADVSNYTDMDQHSFGLRFLDETQTLINESHQDDHSVTAQTWFRENWIIDAHPSTRYVDVVFSGHRLAGTECSAFADNFKLEAIKRIKTEAKLEDLNIPTPIPDKYLKRKSDDSGYEWTDTPSNINILSETTYIQDYLGSNYPSGISYLNVIDSETSNWIEDGFVVSHKVDDKINQTLLSNNSETYNRIWRGLQPPLNDTFTQLDNELPDPAKWSIITNWNLGANYTKIDTERLKIYASSIADVYRLKNIATFSGDFTFTFDLQITSLLAGNLMIGVTPGNDLNSTEGHASLRWNTTSTSQVDCMRENSTDGYSVSTLGLSTTYDNLKHYKIERVGNIVSFYNNDISDNWVLLTTYTYTQEVLHIMLTMNASGGFTDITAYLDNVSFTADTIPLVYNWNDWSKTSTVEEFTGISGGTF